MVKKKKTADIRIEVGDAVKKLNESPSGLVNLIITDPPYNTGMPYDAYDDNKPYAEYMTWTKKWLAAVQRVLHKHGALWIFSPDEWVSEIDMMARHDFKLHKRRHIVWTFTFGVACQKNFSRSHCHLLYFTKNKSKYTFNADAIRVPSARQLVYKDKRANSPGKLPDSTWMLLREQLEPCMTPDKDTWLVSRICGTFHERKKHSPNQIPVQLMERIVLSTSNPGDLVLDPFGGSFSSGVASVRHGRNFIGFDISRKCVEFGRQRVREAQGERNG